MLKFFLFNKEERKAELNFNLPERNARLRSTIGPVFVCPVVHLSKCFSVRQLLWMDLNSHTCFDVDVITESFSSDLIEPKTNVI